MIFSRFQTKSIVWTALLLLVASISGWLALALNNKITTHHYHMLPDAIMTGAHVWQMNKSGELKFRFSSPKLTHYKTNNTTFMQTPHFILYETNKMPWNVWAKHGKTLHGTEELYLWDHVRIHQVSGPNNYETTLHTFALTVFPNKKTAITHHPVTIDQPGSHIDAMGMTVDMNHEIIRLLSLTKGFYEPTKYRNRKF